MLITGDNFEKYTLPLTEKERYDLQQKLYNWKYQNLVNGSTEYLDNIIMNGFAWPGINNISDQNLLDELAEFHEADLNEECSAEALYIYTYKT